MDYNTFATALVILVDFRAIFEKTFVLARGRAAVQALRFDISDKNTKLSGSAFGGWRAQEKNRRGF